MSTPLNDRSLQRIAKRLLRDAADRDDAIQEMWLASLEQDGSPGSSSSGWKVNTLRNRAMRIWDSKRRRGDAEIEARTPLPLPDPVDELDRKSVCELLQGTLDQLPKAQADVIRARFFDGLSLEEIASRTGSPPGTIRARLSRGLAEMRRRLDERTGDPRLTAFVLIRDFRLRPERSLVPASAGVSGLFIAFGVLTSLLAVMAIGWMVLKAGGAGTADTLVGLEDSQSVNGNAETLADRAPADFAPAAQGELTRVAVTAEPTTDGSTATAGGVEEEVASAQIPEGAMRVNIRAQDAAGTPLGGYHGKAWLPSVREAPFEGPAGEDGSLSFLVTEDHLWTYRKEDVEDNKVGTLLKEGSFVKFSVVRLGSARHPDIHVPFAPGTELEVDVQFQSPPGNWSGRVVDRQGEPIVGAEIVNTGQTEWSEGDWEMLFPVDRRRSAEDGRFQFANLVPGKVFFRASKEGYEPTFVEFLVGAGQVDERSLILNPAVPVVGRVVDAAGQGIPNARVLSEAQHGTPTDWILTDAQGFFTMKSMSPGKHKLFAYGPVGTPMENHLDSTTVTLVRETVTWDPILTPSSELTIEVVDSQGKPIAGQLVIFMTESATSDANWWDIQKTDENGLVTADKVPDEEIRVELRGGTQGGFDMGGAPFALLRQVWARPQSYLFQVEQGSRNLGRARGSIVLHDGSPCLDANLSVQGPLSKIAGIVHFSDGSFALDYLPPGEIQMLVERPFGGYWTMRFQVAAGQENDLGVIELPEPGTVRVSHNWPLHDSENRPLYGILAATLTGFHGPVLFAHEQTPTPLEGEFALLPGNYVIMVGIAGYTLDTRSIDVRSGEVLELDFDSGFDQGNEQLVVDEVEADPDDD